MMGMEGLVIVDLPACVCVSFCAGLGLGVLYIFTWKYKSGNQTTNALISLKMQSQGCKKLFGKTVPRTINSLHYGYIYIFFFVVLPLSLNGAGNSFGRVTSKHVN
jgi:hypothetical protein